MRFKWVTLYVVVGFVRCALAQPFGNVPAQLPAARDLMTRVVQAYRGAPIAERVTVSVRTAAVASEGPPRPPRTSQSVITLRAHRAGEMRNTSLSLETPTFSIWFGKGRAVGVASPPTKHTFVRDIGGAPIPRAVEWTLPRMALPQIALTFGADDPWGTLTPFCPGTVWEDSVRVSAEGSLEIFGRTEAGLVRMGIDPSTFRMRTFEIIAASDGDTAQIALRCVPTEPGDPSSWEIPQSGDTLVSTLSDLVPGPAASKPDDPVAALLLQDENLAPFFLADDFAARGERSPSALLMIVFGAGEPPHAVPAPAAAAARAVQELQRLRIREAVAGPGDTRRARLPPWRPLVVFEAAAFTRAGVLKLAEDFRATAGMSPDALAGAVPAAPLVWTLGGQNLLNTLTSEAPCALLVVGEDLKLIRSIPLHDRVDPAGLARELDEALDRLD